MADTSIEWADKSWNPTRGCSRVSEGCKNCYAERQAARFAGPGQPYEGLVKVVGGEPRWTGELALVHEKVREPMMWRKPARVFVDSMSDLFHEAVPLPFVRTIWETMALCPRHTFLVLTKRPERMREWAVRRDAPPLPNVWLGVSVEDQRRADERLPVLRDTPAAVRFVSAEPLLGPLFGFHCPGCGAHADAAGRCLCPNVGRLDWWIVGGESGPGARPMHPGWARSLRDQCQAAGVPFFFKQHGHWAPVTGYENGMVITTNLPGEPTGPRTCLTHRFPDDGQEMLGVGKKAAGRLLDGRTWDEFPRVEESA